MESLKVATEHRLEMLTHTLKWDQFAARAGRSRRLPDAPGHRASTVARDLVNPLNGAHLYGHQSAGAGVTGLSAAVCSGRNRGMIWHRCSHSGQIEGEPFVTLRGRAAATGDRINPRRAPQRGLWFVSHSWDDAPTATHARSALETDSSLNVRAAAVMRVSACASGIGGLVSPFLLLWKRTGLMRATT